MNSFLAALFASAFVFIQCYISGTRLAFSLPAYFVIGVAGLISALGFRRSNRDFNKVCCFSVALLFSYIITRAVISPVEYLARRDLYMVLACLVTYGITVRNFTSPQVRLSILAVMLALPVAEALVGLWQFSHADEWMPFGLIRRPSETRASGMFISSIHFAGFLEAIGPFALAIAAWGTRNKAARVLCGYIAALCYFGAFVSGSRGGWLSAAFSLVVFAVISVLITHRTNRAKLPAVLYSWVITLLIVSGAIAFLADRSEMLGKRIQLVSQIGDVAENPQVTDPYDVRIHNWQAAIDQWNSARMFGTGAGTHLYYGRKYRRSEIQTDPEHAHSDYLELLAEYGVVGAIGMALFLASHLASGIAGFLKLVKVRRENPYSPSPQLAIHVGALTAVSAYLAHSAVDFNLHLPGNALLFAFIFGVLATPPAFSQEDEDPAKVEHPKLGLSGVILGSLSLVLVTVAVLRFPGEYWCEKTRVAVRDERYVDAIALSVKALAAEKKNPYIYYHRGQAFRLHAAQLPRSERVNALNQAVEALESGIAIFPQEENLWVRLGQSLDALGNFKAARDAYQQAIALDPNLGVLHAFYATHLRRVGREAEAEAAEQIARKLGQKDTHDFFESYNRSSD